MSSKSKRARTDNSAKIEAKVPQEFDFIATEIDDWIMNKISFDSEEYETAIREESELKEFQQRETAYVEFFQSILHQLQNRRQSLNETLLTVKAAQEQNNLHFPASHIPRLCFPASTNSDLNTSRSFQSGHGMKQENLSFKAPQNPISAKPFLPTFSITVNCDKTITFQRGKSKSVDPYFAKNKANVVPDELIISLPNENFVTDLNNGVLSKEIAETLFLVEEPNYYDGSLLVEIAYDKNMYPMCPIISAPQNIILSQRQPELELENFNGLYRTLINKFRSNSSGKEFEDLPIEDYSLEEQCFIIESQQNLVKSLHSQLNLSPNSNIVQIDTMYPKNPFARKMVSEIEENNILFKDKFAPSLCKRNFRMAENVAPKLWRRKTDSLKIEVMTSLFEHLDWLSAKDQTDHKPIENAAKDRISPDPIFSNITLSNFLTRSLAPRPSVYYCPLREIGRECMSVSAVGLSATLIQHCVGGGTVVRCANTKSQFTTSQELAKYYFDQVHEVCKQQLTRIQQQKLKLAQSQSQSQLNQQALAQQYAQRNLNYSSSLPMTPSPQYQMYPNAQMNAGISKQNPNQYHQHQNPTNQQQSYFPKSNTMQPISSNQNQSSNIPNANFNSKNYYPANQNFPNYPNPSSGYQTAVPFPAQTTYPQQRQMTNNQMQMYRNIGSPQSSGMVQQRYPQNISPPIQNKMQYQNMQQNQTRSPNVAMAQNQNVYMGMQSTQSQQPASKGRGMVHQNANVNSGYPTQQMGRGVKKSSSNSNVSVQMNMQRNIQGSPVRYQNMQQQRYQNFPQQPFQSQSQSQSQPQPQPQQPQQYPYSQPPQYGYGSQPQQPFQQSQSQSQPPQRPYYNYAQQPSQNRPM